MVLVKPRTMSGVMELLPRDQIAFQRMLETIRRCYERFGFLPVETPLLEYADVLLAKTGGDTERQVYFAQSTGSREQGREPELALRFDLTVPLARYVAQHQGQLSFPFRRYQIQRVYRGESAQEGRYREFYQCDIDVIGRDQLALEFDAEIPAVIYETFRELAFGKFTIHVNNRRVLTGLLEAAGVTDSENQALVLREIDKLDKKGRPAVLETLVKGDFGLDRNAAERVMDDITAPGTSDEILQRLKAAAGRGKRYETGVSELAEVAGTLRDLGVPEDHWQINLAIARGLDYYTGTVYETILDKHPELGSVCSGGRYDNLASQYTKHALPGVGISIGATRLFYQLCKLGLFDDVSSSVEVLVTQMDAGLKREYRRLATTLRDAGLNTELYFEAAKFAKQMKYANKAAVPLVVIMGEDEVRSGRVVLKDMRSGAQESIAASELVTRVRKVLVARR